MLVPYVKAAYEAASHAALPAARVTFGRDARMLAIAVCAIALQPLAALVAVAVVSVAEAALRVSAGFAPHARSATTCATSHGFDALRRIRRRAFKEALARQRRALRKAFGAPSALGL